MKNLITTIQKLAKQTQKNEFVYGAMYAREKLLCENDIYTHISKWNLPLSEELKSFYIHYEFEYLYVNNISLSRIDQVARRRVLEQYQTTLEKRTLKTLIGIKIGLFLQI